MPAKKQHITEEERAKRIRETAREYGTSNSPKDFERAFDKVVKDKGATPLDHASRASEKNR